MLATNFVLQRTRRFYTALVRPTGRPRDLTVVSGTPLQPSFALPQPLPTQPVTALVGPGPARARLHRPEAGPAGPAIRHGSPVPRLRESRHRPAGWRPAGRTSARAFTTARALAARPGMPARTALDADPGGLGCRRAATPVLS